MFLAHIKLFFISIHLYDELLSVKQPLYSNLFRLRKEYCYILMFLVTFSFLHLSINI
jgi:hypothetical protein